MLILPFVMRLIPLLTSLLIALIQTNLRLPSLVAEYAPYKMSKAEEEVRMCES